MVFILLISSLWLLGAETQTIRTFPNVEGKNLHGVEVQFPEAFAPKAYHVCLIAFVRQQQTDVDTWITRLGPLVAQRDDLEFMELPTISKMNAFMRWFIYRGMRSGIEDATTRSRTITLHLDKKPFKEALDIQSEKEIVILLVDEKGVVRWQHTGPWSQEKEGALLDVLEAGSKPENKPTVGK